MRGFAVRIVAASAVTLCVVLSSPRVSIARAAEPPLTAGARVYQFDITGTVDPLLAHGLQRAVRIATRDARALILRIDTPGGLMSAMRTIVTAINGATIPVVCWVGPSGARAASAGAFILMGCPHAYMARGTNVGAAHPVGITGDIESDKVLNDAAAYMRSLAEQHGRNATWAEKAVRESVSITADEALTLKVIDGIVPTPCVAGCDVQRLHLTASEALLHTLVDPNLAFLFFLFGIAGIVLEVLHPGIGVGGILGILFLVSSLIMLGMMPVNLGALVLLAAGMAFLIVDLHTPGAGFGTVIGTLCLIFGGLFLFDASVPNARVSKIVVIAAAAVMAAFFVFVVQAVRKARKMPPGAGSLPKPGTEGVVTQTLDPNGIVLIAGEHWSATTGGDPIHEGLRVTVAGATGLTLNVEPTQQPITTGGAE